MAFFLGLLELHEHLDVDSHVHCPLPDAGWGASRRCHQGGCEGAGDGEGVAEQKSAILLKSTSTAQAVAVSIIISEAKSTSLPSNWFQRRSPVSGWLAINLGRRAGGQGGGAAEGVGTVVC